MKWYRSELQRIDVPMTSWCSKTIILTFDCHIVLLIVILTHFTAFCSCSSTPRVALSYHPSRIEVIEGMYMLETTAKSPAAIKTKNQSSSVIFSHISCVYFFSYYIFPYFICIRNGIRCVISIKTLLIVRANNRKYDAA